MKLTKRNFHPTGTEKERDVFKYAITRNDRGDEKEKSSGRISNAALNGGNVGGAGSGGTTDRVESGGTGGNKPADENRNNSQSILPLPPISMRFEEVQYRPCCMSLLLELFNRLLLITMHLLQM